MGEVDGKSKIVDKQTVGKQEVLDLSWGSKTSQYHAAQFAFSLPPLSKADLETNTVQVRITGDVEEEQKVKLFDISVAAASGSVDSRRVRRALRQLRRLGEV